MVAGDSLGFTAAFPPPTRDQLPGSIASIDMRAIIGCGSLAAAAFTPVDAADEGAGSFDCSRQVEAEQIGLGVAPEWMVFFAGGWEHIAWTTPDGRTLGARTPELRRAILDQLVQRASRAAQAGTRTAFPAWICPTGVTPNRTGDYAYWFNDILRDAARAVPGSIVVEATDRTCVNADPGGPADRREGRGVHRSPPRGQALGVAGVDRPGARSGPLSGAPAVQGRLSDAITGLTGFDVGTWKPSLRPELLQTR